MVICLERRANDLHMVQLMPCFVSIQIGFTFLVPAYPGCPGKERVKWVTDCDIDTIRMWRELGFLSVNNVEVIMLLQ